MATRIYTRTGDKGETALFRGGRVLKDNPRVEAYGTVDELNAMLGVALAHGAPPPLAKQLADVQALLLELGADLATPPGMHKGRAGIVEADIERLERAIDDAEAQLPALGSFILPAGTPVATALHVARAVCRRAERRCVTLRAAEPGTSDICVRFLNRLSDLLFVLARLANHQAGVPEWPWRSRAMG